MKLYGASNQTAISPLNLAHRLSMLEEQFPQFPMLGSDSNRRNRKISERLNSIERNVSRLDSYITWNYDNLRISELEVKMNRLMTYLNADNCTSNPCQNGGTCANTFGGYICRCSNAWTGVNCAEDVNECAIFADTKLGCQNFGSCENTPGGYT